MKTLGYSTVGSVLDLSIKILIALCPIEYWAGWIIYILKELQGGTNPADMEKYLESLSALRRAITECLENERW